MKKQIFRGIIYSLLLISTVLLILSALLLINGSLEEFPRPDQQSAARGIGGFLTFVFLIIDVGLILILKKRPKTSPNSD